MQTNHLGGPTRRTVAFLLSASLCLVFTTGCGLLVVNQQPAPVDVQFYTIPFLCESNEAGDLVQASSIVLHNPEAGSVTIYRRAVLVISESDPPPDAVSWSAQVLVSDEAVRLDCDTFARLVSGDGSTTFNEQFAAGSRVDGFFTIGVEANSDAERLDAFLQTFQADGASSTTALAPELVLVDAWPPVTN